MSSTAAPRRTPQPPRQATPAPAPPLTTRARLADDSPTTPKILCFAMLFILAPVAAIDFHLQPGLSLTAIVLCALTAYLIVTRG